MLVFLNQMLYICNVFFIVLDLKIISECSGTPFFMSLL